MSQTLDVAQQRFRSPGHDRHERGDDRGRHGGLPRQSRDVHRARLPTSTVSGTSPAAGTAASPSDRTADRTGTAAPPREDRCRLPARLRPRREQADDQSGIHSGPTTSSPGARRSRGWSRRATTRTAPRRSVAGRERRSEQMVLDRHLHDATPIVEPGAARHERCRGVSPRCAASGIDRGRDQQRRPRDHRGAGGQPAAQNAVARRRSHRQQQREHHPHRGRRCRSSAAWRR